jgi:hypothetical protein
MLLVTVYRWRDDAHGKEAGRKLMEAYGEVGNDPGLVAHYVFADGTGGVVIVDTDDVTAAYRTSLRLGEFVDLHASRTYPAIALDAAVTHVGEYLGS